MKRVTKRVLTKWQNKYAELQERKFNAISTCVVHKRLDERIDDIRYKIINAGGELPTVS